MARTPFKLRSGNTTPFKQMGSSPVKDDGKKTLLGGIGKIFQSFGDFLSSKKEKSSTNIGENLRKKYGTGEYRIGKSKASEAGIRPGESKRQFKKRYKKVVVDEGEGSGEGSGSGFKPIEFSGKKGDPYSYRTTESGGYQYKLGSDAWTTATDKGAITAIGELFKQTKEQ
tara:strand:- start:438 stop:947 length:510 start_codon:yes stop_codon:yes gene_type:complete